MGTINIETTVWHAMGTMREYSDKYGKEATVAKYEKSVLNAKDPELSFYFANEYRKYANINEHEQVVIDAKNPEWSYYWTRTFEECRLLDHIIVVGESKNPEWCYHMAILFKQKQNVAYTGYFRQLIYESGSAEWNYRTALAFKGIENIEPHRQVVLNSGDETYIRFLKHDVDGEIVEVGPSYLKKYPLQ